MTSPEAAKLLELPVDASLEQIEARFLDLRRKLEDKIAKAPTPGLQAKYRESLAEITTAFETLTLAADGSSLPLLNKQSAVSSQPSAGTNASAAASSSGFRSQVSDLPSKPKASNKEFLIVTVIALAVLGGGGWFVMKTRAEKAEQTRIAAEQKIAAEARVAAEKAEAERRAELARQEAEAKRQAEEAEKARLAAEQKRLEKLAADVRVGFSETKLLWQQAERAEREAQREVDELRNSFRSLRDVSEGRRRAAELQLEASAEYQRWLSGFLASHPARRAEVRTEELLNARQIESAAEALVLYQQALAGLDQEIADRRPGEQNLYGSLTINSTPAGVPWEMVDAFDNRASGTTPGVVSRTGIGPAIVHFRRPGWNPGTVTVPVLAGKEARAEFAYRPASLVITSTPAGAEVFVQGKTAGKTPLTLADLPAVEHLVEVRLPDHHPLAEKVVLRPGETSTLNLKLNRLTDEEIVQAFTTRFSGTWQGNLRGTLFFCKLVAGSIQITEWNGSGKYAGQPPVTMELQLLQRQPLMMKRIMLLNGQRYPSGELLEDGNRLIYRARSPNGKNTADAPMQRSSN
jgi:hypothetical protein